MGEQGSRLSERSMVKVVRKIKGQDHTHKMARFGQACHSGGSRISTYLRKINVYIQCKVVQTNSHIIEKLIESKLMP